MTVPHKNVQSDVQNVQKCTIKRKPIIRDQNWFRTECELPRDNLC